MGVCFVHVQAHKVLHRVSTPCAEACTALCAEGLCLLMYQFVPQTGSAWCAELSSAVQLSLLRSLQGLLITPVPFSTFAPL
jgi:hypothetical protein